MLPMSKRQSSRFTDFAHSRKRFSRAKIFAQVVHAGLVLAVSISVAHGATRAGFDAQGRVLMHGVPRFVLGVYDSGGSYSPDHAFWEQQIFSPAGPRGLDGFALNLYLNYFLGAMPIDSTDALLDVLQTHGLMYLQTGNCSSSGSWTRMGPGSFSIMSQTYVQQFAQHPAAAGYYIMDECDDSLIAETHAHRQQLETWDPQGITFAATLAAGYRDPALWVAAADVLGTDPYPLYGPEPAAGYTHFIVGDFTSKLRAKARAGLPVWPVLQFFQFTTDSRMPTPSEMRAHAVMAIVEGAAGLFWWDIGVNGLRQSDPATVSAYMGHLKTLTAELARLEPALLADPSPGALAGNSTRFADPVAGRIAQLDHDIAVEWLYSRIQWYQEEKAALQNGDTSKSGGMLNGAADVRTLTKVVNGVGYVFAYNYTNQSRAVTFTWERPLASVTESGDGRGFPVAGRTWTDTLGPYEARIYVVVPRSAGPRPAGDFDGDGRKDRAVYQPSTGEWFIFGSATGFRTTVFGSPASSGLGDTPVPADFDGDGVTDLAIYRAATAEWIVFGSATGLQTRVFGAPAASGLGDTPVPADFDGDGKADLAIYRKATGEWFIFGSATGLQTRVFGAPAASGLGDTPLAADFDGDGKADLAIYRKATGEWFVFGSATGLQTLAFGAPAVSGLGDMPVPVDLDGDGRADYVIYRQATAQWFGFGSATGFQSWTFGAPAASGLGDMPVPGDFDGDGRADVAIFRATTGQWFVLRSLDGALDATAFGGLGDGPVPAPPR
jgi:hypothetical protein